VAFKIGVDVGGTFTKAVACDADSSEVLAQAVVSTTHSSRLGVAAGVVQSIEQLMRDAHSFALGSAVLVAHSTTQAVNALLEGDTSVVGVVGLGRHPDLRRARKRTHVGEIRLAPGRILQTRHAFVDVTGTVDRPTMQRAVEELIEDGAEVLCFSEAFGVEDPRGEWLGLEIAAELGVPACAGHELSGLYGLELRTVTAALNASILPTALRTAEVVERAVADQVPGVPVLVMRGDGGAANLEAMRRRPILTAFSGPAASVAGALHHLAVGDGVVVEVGGTSTNVSAIRGGRPVLAYVRVLEHVTCVRSLDVRVVGVAGGSMLRVKRRYGRLRIDEVGPRSAHIAGLPYCSFSDAAEVKGGQACLIAPKPGDPPEYVVIETSAGRRFALTLTCAANALGLVPLHAYARGNAEAARAGFELLAASTGNDWRDLAGAVVRLAAAKISQAVVEAADEHRLDRPTIVGVGGGAGAVVPEVAEQTRLQWEIPRHAEVISSIGDAQSLVRVEVERSLAALTAEELARAHRDAEEAAVQAGAAPATVYTESHPIPERRALRAVGIGALALDSSSPGATLGHEDLRLIAKRRLGESVELIATSGFYFVFAAGDGIRDFVIIDSRGSIATLGRGQMFEGIGAEIGPEIREALSRAVRHLGPITITPAVKVIRGSRLSDFSLLASQEALLDAVVAECDRAGKERVIVLTSRS
jgi:N-methylhydantoinase A